MQSVDWDIFRVIVAVADSGSAVAASERLGVNASTVLRRIAKFEEQHGLRLFERHQTGYTPTAQCEAVVETARTIEQNVADISRDILGSDVRLEGTVSFTTTDTFLESILAPYLAEFSKLHPKIHLEVAVTNSRLNLTRHDADVALRPSSKPPETLIGQRVSGLAFAVYRAKDALGDVGSFDGDPFRSVHPWVGIGDSLQGSPVGKWIADNVPEENIVISADTFPAIAHCAKAGAGLAVLPCCLGDRDPALERIGVPLDNVEIALWLLTPRGYRNAARVRAFIDFIAPALRSARPLFEGQSNEI